MLMRFMTGLFRIPRVRGGRYFLYLLAGYFLPRFFLSLFQWIRPPRTLRKWAQSSGLPSQNLQESIPTHFTRWADWPVDALVRQKVETYLNTHMEQDLLLGQVDTDGRLMAVFGPLPGWVLVSQAEFVSRHRFSLDVVLRDGLVLIRKNFRGDRQRFRGEWHHLVKLMGKANVPDVVHADETQTILYKNMIVGRTVRDVLVEAGANILNVQTEMDPAILSLTGIERLNAVLARGTAYLSRCFPASFFCALERQMDAIHREGVAGLSLTFGNVMVDQEGQPWLIDFEGAEAYRSLQNPLFLWQRDQDRQKYNRIYGRSLLTEVTARQALQRQKQKLNGWYAPIDFGGGVTIGGFWTIDSGTGRWTYLNERVMAPLLAGKRVLDLGSNNGLMPLLMLRAGAREVVGLELSPEFVESAHLVHHVFEWRDMRAYPFTLHQANMLEILDQDWGEFDVITALCTLYYLQPNEMAAVVERAAQLAPILIIQANDHTRSEARERKAEKSSLSYLKRLMEENGFPRIDEYAPLHFSRPLLIGYRN